MQEMINVIYWLTLIGDKHKLTSTEIVSFVYLQQL